VQRWEAPSTTIESVYVPAIQESLGAWTVTSVVGAQKLPHALPRFEQPTLTALTAAQVSKHSPLKRFIGERYHLVIVGRGIDARRSEGGAGADTGDSSPE